MTYAFRYKLQTVAKQPFYVDGQDSVHNLDEGRKLARAAIREGRANALYISEFNNQPVELVQEVYNMRANRTRIVVTKVKGPQALRDMFRF